MKNLKAIVILFLLFFFVATTKSWAAELTLTKVGTLPTTGIDYSIIDYVGGVPMLEGTATPGAQVVIKIKSTNGYTAAASPSGIWQFVPVSLDTGANDVTITSGTKSLSFVLNFNSTTTVTPTPTVTPTATVTLAAAGKLPETGIWENMVAVVLVGIGVMFFGRYVNERMRMWEGKK